MILDQIGLSSVKAEELNMEHINYLVPIIGDHNMHVIEAMKQYVQSKAASSSLREKLELFNMSVQDMLFGSRPELQQKILEMLSLEERDQL